LMEHLWNSIDSSTTAAETATLAVRNAFVDACEPGELGLSDGQAAEEVGIFMAMRNCFEWVDTIDLLEACRRLQPKAKVLLKFIAFMEDELVSSSSASDDESAG